MTGLSPRKQANTMNRWTKTLLLWLVMAALPLQGFAAAIQVSCAGNHGTVAMAHLHEAQAGHEHGGHEHGAHQHIANDQHQPEKATGLAHDSDSDHTACASCCPGVAMAPPLSISTPSGLPSQAVVVSHPQFVPGYVPPNLERPPKQLSA